MEKGKKKKETWRKKLNRGRKNGEGKKEIGDVEEKNWWGNKIDIYTDYVI